MSASGPLLGIIGGSSLLGCSLFQGLETRTVDGTVVHVGRGVVFVQRHKTTPEQTYELPHNVRHAAIAKTLVSMGCTQVVGVCSVGALNQSVPPGTVLVCDDYVNLWGVQSGLNDERAHIAPTLDQALRKRLLSLHADARDSGVYVQTRGPRFETKAEVRFLATLGDVVGMTGAHEATHCQEVGLAYAMLCMVDNWGNGIGPDELSLDSFRALVHANEGTVQAIVAKLLD